VVQQSGTTKQEVNMKKKTLKALPRGEGSMSYVTRRNTEYICYKKIIGEGANKKRHAVYGTTQQECLKLMKEYEAEYNNQQSLLNPAKEGNDKNLLAPSILAWLYDTKFKTLKAGSFDLLECVFINHIKDSDIGKMQFSRVTADDINKLLIEKKDQGYSLSTTDKIYSILYQYFDTVYRNNRSKNPMLDVNKITKKDHTVKLSREVDEDDDIFIQTTNGMEFNSSKIILTDDEIKRFVDVAKVEHRNRHQGWKHGCGIIFILFSFMRVGEAVALKWKDIDFEKKTVSIYKNMSCVQDRSDSPNKQKWILTTTKTNAGTRINLLSDEAFTAIQTHFERMAKGRSLEEMQNHYVFETNSGNFANPINLYKNVKQIMQKANISSTKAGMHKLRHSGISYYIRHGVPIDVIAKMAGHSSSVMTRKVYYGLVDDQFKDALQIMNNIRVTE
jgi:integrase